MLFDEVERTLRIGLALEQLADRSQPVGPLGQGGFAGLFQDFRVVLGGCQETRGTKS